MAAKVVGPTKRRADSVMMVRTWAPACTRRRARWAIL